MMGKFDSEFSKNQRALGQVVLEFAVELIEEDPDGGPRMYDFGDSVTTMPIPDFKNEGTYLTSSICFLYLRDGKEDEAPPNYRNKGDVFVGPKGTKFIGIEFDMNTSPEGLHELLVKAKEKLITAGVGDGK
jgi:hypothetical protein